MTIPENQEAHANTGDVAVDDSFFELYEGLEEASSLPPAELVLRPKLEE